MLLSTLDFQHLVYLHLYALCALPGLRGSGALRFVSSTFIAQGCLLNSLIDDDTLSFFHVFASSFLCSKYNISE